MFENTKAFSSFSVNDIPKAKEFYGEVLGLNVREDHGMLLLNFEGGSQVMIYPKEDHTPATFTVLNLPVSDIHAAVKELAGLGIKFEKYENTDEEGIDHNEGPLIAWFKDPAGNFISVIQDEGITQDFKMRKETESDLIKGML